MKWQIPYAGEVYEFDDMRLTGSEARLQKRITGGLTPAEAEEKRLQRDEEAWLAALAIARRRIGMSADDAVDVDMDLLELFDIKAPQPVKAADPEPDPAT